MEKLAQWKNTSMENVISQYAATDFGSSDECGGGGRVPSITTWNAVDEVGNDGSEDEDDKMEEQDIT